MIANTVTGFRVLISIALLFCPVFSPAFYVLYLIAGLSDMIDGTIARRMNTVSEYGARFDTAADFVFVTVCLIKLLPVISIPAVFDCIGPIPESLQSLNTRIFKEWLPGNPDYELCGNANVEWYDCVNGEKTDKDYHSAIWIPVKKKA